MPRLSTQLKVASGYILLTLLLFASIQYINHEMKALTETDDNETILNLRRRVTNEIVGQLYQAEIIGQSTLTVSVRAKEKWCCGRFVGQDCVRWLLCFVLIFC